MNCKIDIDKFICFLIENKSDAKQAWCDKYGCE